MSRTLADSRSVIIVAMIALAAACSHSQRAAQVNAEQAGSAPSGDGRAIAISNVTVIDVVSGGEHRDVTVVIKGDQIAGIGRQITVPRRAIRVQGTGKFLIPGLWDMHSHNEASGSASVDLFLANGVVGTRDMGSDLDFILTLRDRVRRGEVLGPEILAAGPILDDAPADWPFRRRVTNGQEAVAAVRDLKKRGVDFIKVHNYTPREAFFAIADEAPKLGLPFVGHIPLKVTVEEGVVSGMKSIEHFSESRLFRECPGKGPYSAERCRPIFEKIAKGAVWQTPTGAFSEYILEVFAGKPILHAEYASDSVIELNRRNLEAAKIDEKILNILRSQNQSRRAAVRDLLAVGAQFLAGCDGWVPGFCLHDELQWLTEAGLSPLQAIQAATINPAKFLGREKTQGTVELGKRADLVLLEADPRIDIRNTSRIHAVVVQGRVLSRAVIDQMIAARRRK
jgi:amidohydrolase family protein